jgi:hypothetical protein
MKRGFGEHSFASQQWLGDSFGNVNCPVMVPVIPPGEGNDEAGIGDSLHERENPLREETSGGPPLIAPA